MHLQLCGMINGKPFIIADLSTARNLSSYPIFTYIKCYSSLLILIVDTFLFTLICSLWRALPLYTVSHVCRQYLFYVLCAHLVIYFILFPFYPFFLCSAVVSNVKSLSLVNYPNVFRWYANNEQWKKNMCLIYLVLFYVVPLSLRLFCRHYVAWNRSQGEQSVIIWENKRE